MSVPDASEYVVRIRAYKPPTQAGGDMRLDRRLSEEFRVLNETEVVDKVEQIIQQAFNTGSAPRGTVRYSVLGFKWTPSETKVDGIIIAGLRIDAHRPDGLTMWEVFTEDGRYGWALEGIDPDTEEEYDMSVHGDVDEAGFVWTENNKRGLVKAKSAGRVGA